MFRGIDSDPHSVGEVLNFEGQTLGHKQIAELVDITHVFNINGMNNKLGLGRRIPT